MVAQRQARAEEAERLLPFEDSTAALKGLLKNLGKVGTPRGGQRPCLLSPKLNDVRAWIAIPTTADWRQEQT